MNELEKENAKLKRKINKLEKEKLLEEYWSMVNWEPDYEECGFQRGFSEDEIRKIVNKIKKISPSWETPEEKKEAEIRKYNKETEKLIEKTKIKELFEDLEKPLGCRYFSGKWTDKDYINKCEKFLEEKQNRTISSMTVKQVKWLLNIGYCNGLAILTARIADYLNKHQKKYFK